MREEGEIVCAEAQTSQTRLLPGCKIRTDSNRQWILPGVFVGSEERALWQLGRQHRRGFAACCRVGWGGNGGPLLLPQLALFLRVFPGWLGSPSEVMQIRGCLQTVGAALCAGKSLPALAPLQLSGP